MSEYVRPICLGCQHFHKTDTTQNACDAFPDGIPDAILLSDRDHRQAYPGDRGLRFLPKTPNDSAYAAQLFPAQPSPH